MAKIFISYSRKDIRLAKHIAQRLQRFYRSEGVFLDDDIGVGTDWWQVILGRLAEADVFVYLISDNSLASNACRAEFLEALRLNKKVIPVIIQPNINWEDAPQSFRFILNQIQQTTFTSISTDESELVGAVKDALYGTDVASPKQVVQDFAMQDVDGQNVNIGGTQNITIQYVIQSNDPVPKPVVAYGNSQNIRKMPIIWMSMFGLVIVLGVIFIVVMNRVDGLNIIPTQVSSAANPTRATEETSISEEDVRATGAAQAYGTLTALAPTNTPTITLTPTETPISSSDIQRTAQAEIFATETQAAATQAIIAQQTQNAVLTEQFIAGATATYIAVLSLTPPATLIPTATNTLVPIPTPTDTPTDTSLIQEATEYNVLVEVTTSWTNLRSGPGLSYGIRSSVGRGEVFVIEGVQDDWYRVNYNASDAWINANAVENVMQVTITSNWANLRSGPGLSYGIRSSVGRGEVFVIEGVQDDWYRVNYNASDAWIHSNQVEIVGVIE